MEQEEYPILSSIEQILAWLCMATRPTTLLTPDTQNISLSAKFTEQQQYEWTFISTSLWRNNMKN